MNLKAWYEMNDGKSLIALFKDGILSESEFRGFCKGNIHKYVKRYNGIEDLVSAKNYILTLIDFENEIDQKKQDQMQNTTQEQNTNE